MVNIGILIVSISYIYNLSGFIYDLSKGIYKVLNPNKQYMGQPLIKPFGCQICMTFWILFGYSLFGLELSLIHSLGVGIGSAFFSTLIDRVLLMTNNIINKIK